MQPLASGQSLADRFFERSGKLADKWEQYLGIYESELAPYLVAGEPVSLLEIGVQNGGSLELWADYLPAGSRVVGLDIDPKVGDLRFGNPAISVAVLDATDAQAMTDALGNSAFDIIIDDGSHICADVIRTFEALFGRLAPGGKFIIEDLHTSYYASHGGGFRQPQTSIEWLKDMVDALNADHFAEGAVPDAEQTGLRRLNSLLARVAFYDSVAVIEKLRVEKLRPYRRLSAGLASEVVPPQSWILQAPQRTLQTMIFAHPAAREVDAVLVAELAARQAAIERLRAEVAQAQHERDAAGAASAAREQALANEIERLNAASAEAPDPSHPHDGEDTARLCDRVLAYAGSKDGA